MPPIDKFFALSRSLRPALFATVLVLGLVGPLRAPAAEEDFIPVFASQSAGLRIPIYRKDVCLDTLKPIFAPEAIIAKGLAALQSGPANEAASCLNEVVVQWTNLIPLPVPGEDLRLVELTEKLDGLTNAINCINPYPNGTAEAKNWALWKKAFCKAGFPDSSAQKELRAARDIAQRALNEYRFAKEADADFSSIADILVSSKSAERRSEVAKKLECASWSYEISKCKEGPLSPAETKSLSDELSQLQAKSAQEATAYYENRRDLQAALSYRGPKEMELDRSEMASLMRQLMCLELGGEFPNSPKDLFCKTRGLPRSGDAEPIKAKVRALLPDPAAFTASWKASGPERLRLRKLSADSQARAEEARYGLRRLLAQQRAFFKKNPHSSLEDFCSANEAQQLKDREYSLKTGKMSIFTSPTDWEWAAEHGTTEPEFAAVKEYTGSFYATINPRIWRAAKPSEATPLSEPDRLYVEKLNQAIERLPPYREGLVRRFAFMPREILAAHEQGKIVTYDAFTSTSMRDDWSWKGGKGGSLHGFLIYGGKGGALVDPISTSPGEGEVLFKAGSRFKVLSRKERIAGSGIYDFVLAEVDEAGNVIADVKEGN